MQKGIIQLRSLPSIISSAAVVGSKERNGPLGKCFVDFDETDTFGMPTWEQSESEMQRIALKKAMEYAGLGINDIDAIFAGDLMNQCTSSGYGLANFDTQFFGLFGACSTIVEALSLGSMLVDCGKYRQIAAVTSSHNCSAERQFRFPLEYGGQRPPTAQWTVTGAGAFIVGMHKNPPYICETLPGRVTDKGITDANNMGAAMAPAAADTIYRYFTEKRVSLEKYSAIITGDLGYEGSGILIDLLRSEGLDISHKHLDCGLLIYDRERQDAHAGGSGCGCAASVLHGYVLNKMKELSLKDVLFIATGAMMSPSSVQQGLTIPSIAHLIHITMSEKID